VSLKDGRLRASDVVSLVLNPSLLTGVFFCVLATKVEPLGVQQPAMGLLAFVFATVVPVGILFLLKARGTLSDLEMSVRTERERVYALCAAGYAVGAALLYLAGASWQMWGLLAFHVPNTFLLAWMNRALKVSIHTMVLSYLWIASMYLLDPDTVSLGLLVPVAAWARWDAGNHSVRELLLGLWIGITLAPLEIAILRMALGS
jgi:hypothetical protein